MVKRPQKKHFMCIERKVIKSMVIKSTVNRSIMKEAGGLGERSGFDNYGKKRF